MSKSTPAIVRAIDVGYGNTKYTLSQRNIDMDAEVGLFPSLAPRATQSDFTGGLMAKADRIVVQVDGESYSVGMDALAESKGIYKREVASAYSTSRAYRALFLGALQKMRLTAIDYMVVGLPLTTYDRYAKELTELLTGTHEVPNPSLPLFACKVTSGPGWPVFADWSRSFASAPRASPSTMRLGFCRSTLSSSRFAVTLSCGLICKRTLFGALSTNSGTCSIVIIRSPSGKHPSNVLANVVFPDPVLPTTATPRRFRTTSTRNSAISGGRAPCLIQSSIAMTTMLFRRKQMVGPSTATGGSVASTRNPGSLVLTIASADSLLTVIPELEASSVIAASIWLALILAPVLNCLPPCWTHTSSGRLIMMSVTDWSSNHSCRVVKQFRTFAKTLSSLLLFASPIGSLIKSPVCCSHHQVPNLLVLPTGK